MPVAALLLLIQTAPSQEPFQARLEGTPAAHSLFWPTKPDYRYFFQMSPDLNFWQNTGEYVLGDGTIKDILFERTEDRLFYRIHEAGFLVLPSPDQRVDLIDGVCFGFNLALLPQIPAKLRIYSRTWNSGTAWTQRGLIRDIATLRGVKTVRGSVVWIPATVPFVN